MTYVVSGFSRTFVADAMRAFYSRCSEGLQAYQPAGVRRHTWRLARHTIENAIGVRPANHLRSSYGSPPKPSAKVEAGRYREGMEIAAAVGLAGSI